MKGIRHAFLLHRRCVQFVRMLATMKSHSLPSVPCPELSQISKPEPRKKEPSCQEPDIRLSIGKTVFVAEKQQLIKSSPYFASLLRDSAHDNLDTLAMSPPENVKTSIFLAVLFSLCNGNLKLDITTTNVCDIIVLSKYFHLPQLEEECLTGLRGMLPTLGMDELCRIWRRANTHAFEKVTTLAVMWISLKMDNTSKCREFLDFTVEELVALMSHASFLPLPLLEKDVCMAVIAWCEHDPENRKKPDVLRRILPEIVWDDSTEHLQPLLSQHEKLWKISNRAATAESLENDDRMLLEKYGYEDGIVVGDNIYAMEGPYYDRKFFRINWKNGERAEWNAPGALNEADDLYGGCTVPHRLCLVQYAGTRNIGCLMSYMDNDYTGLCNTIALYDTVADARNISEHETGLWKYLPDLPRARWHPAFIQCGNFLCVIGGRETEAYRPKEANAHRGYRLDLRRLTEGDVDDQKAEWERIADLNASRIYHCVKVHHGRIVVFGGQTETTVDGQGEKAFETARWSEAYDPALNTWTMFEAT